MQCLSSKSVSENPRRLNTGAQFSLDINVSQLSLDNLLINIGVCLYKVYFPLTYQYIITGSAS